MKFGDTFSTVSGFSPYQKRIFALLSLSTVIVALADVNFPFLLYTPGHRCLFKEEKNSTLPLETSSFRSSRECFTRNANKSGTDNDSMAEYCSSWKYDQSVFISTFVSEHDLVCLYSDIPAYIEMVTYSGGLVGALVQGIFSDRFGRKNILIISLALGAVTGLAAAWTPDVYVFTALRCLNSMATRSIYINSFVLVIELVGKSKRYSVGVFFNYFYSGGLVLLAGIGYVIRQWNLIQIVCSTPMLIFFFFGWIIPESPRWLISRSRMAEAKAVAMKFHVASNTESYVPSEEDRKSKTFTWATFCSCNRTLMWYSLINSINFFVVFNCYYGITLNIENLSGDFFLNFLINGLVDIPAITIALLFSIRIGRKRLYLSGMAVAGLSLLCSAITLLLTEEDAAAMITMTMIGKTGIRISMCVIYVWSAELFPTTMRSSIMGISLTCGNAGLVVSPYIGRLSTSFPELFGPAGPLFIFGSLSIVSAVLTLTLPETKHKPLPETMAHVQQTTRY